MAILQKPKTKTTFEAAMTVTKAAEQSFMMDANSADPAPSCGGAGSGGESNMEDLPNWFGEYDLNGTSFIFLLWSSSLN